MRRRLDPGTSKQRKTMHWPNQKFMLDDLEEKVRLEELEIFQCASVADLDVGTFSEKFLGVKPFRYQLELADLFSKNQFVAVRWPRQTGKSFWVSLLLLKYAIDHPNNHIAIVGPSWRQTKLNIRRIGDMSRKLPFLDFHAQKTRINFGNGSVIEAFPNNPETIRGPTFHVIWEDESNFVPNDEELYDAILFTLGTTNGKFIATSTPWNTDSLFWKMCCHKDFEDFARSHISWEEAIEPIGPLKPAIIEKIKRQFGDDPARWRREMEAEWAEDTEVWLAQSLIVNCIGTQKTCGFDLQEHDPEKSYSGEFFAGLDLAQTRDFCVFAIIEQLNDKLLLRHLKIFSQPTRYAHVLGYVKAIQDRWGYFQKIRVDTTREGPSFIEDMKIANIPGAEGVTFSVPRKSEIAGVLKQRMQNQQFIYPLLTWDKPYHADICSELNIERFQFRNDGNIGFYHPNGTHDDVFWAIALAVYSTVTMQPIEGIGVGFLPHSETSNHYGAVRNR